MSNPIKIAGMLATTAACAALAAAAPSRPAQAHGIAGNRVFPATIATDDPSVGDEADFPVISSRKIHDDAPGEPDKVDTEYSGSISKLILPNFAVSIGDAYKREAPNGGKAHTGFDNLGTGLKYQFYKNEEHEILASVGLDIDWGGTGARNADAERYTTYTPAVFVGKGLGDLPDGLAYLKPFAVTSVMGVGIPSRASSATLTDDGDLRIDRHPETFNFGGAVEYSIPYLQSTVRDLGLGAPFDRLIPLVELDMSTPINRLKTATTGTVNPGVLWSGDAVQFGIEAIIPVNHQSGNNVGLIGQLHFYLDDIAPSMFGNPLFGN